MVGRPEVVETLVRLYSPAIAGLPTTYGFEPASGRFSLFYRPWRAASRKTVVFVPERRYPDGAEISVDGGRVTRRTGESVYIRYHPGTSKVHVTVVPPD